MYTYLLFIVPYSHVYSLTFQQCRYVAYVCLSVVIREEHLRLYGLGCLYQLPDGHRVWLVAWQEGYVYLLYALHFRNVLSVSGNVNPQSVNGNDISVIASLRVIFRVSLGGVVCRHGLYGDVFGNLYLLTISHSLALAIHLRNSKVFHQESERGSMEMADQTGGNNEFGEIFSYHGAYGQMLEKRNKKIGPDVE